MMNPEALTAAIPLPTCVNWELTYACQLRCSHCYTESGRVPSRKLPREKLVRIAEVLGSMGLASVHLVGGEPLLVPEVFELGDILRASGTHVILYTNGVGISRALAARIAATFPRAQVSLDGMSAAVHDAIRGREGAFADAERTLAHFDELAAPPRGNGFGFGVDVVVVRRNREQLEAFCRELPRRYPRIGSLLFGAAVPVGFAESDAYIEKELLTEEQLAELDDESVERRLRSLLPSAVMFEVCSNKRLRRPELAGFIEVEADGSVRLFYKGTALGDMLVDEPRGLFRRALGRATDPFVRARMDRVETTADWARALGEIRAHFAPVQPLRARPERRPERMRGGRSGPFPGRVDMNERDDGAASASLAAWRLNGSLSLSVTCGVRLANRPYTRFRIDVPENLALVRWLLGALAQGSSGPGELDGDASLAVLSAAAEKGLVVTNETDPGEAAPFACDLDDPTLLDLVPEAWRAGSAGDGADLVPNPTCVVQAEDTLPPALVGRVRVDASLRARTLSDDPIRNHVRAPLAGLPQGLGPLRDGARVWLQHPVMGIWQPFEASTPLAHMLRRIAGGEFDPACLPAAARTRLVLAHVLGPPASFDGAAREARITAMRESLAKNGYVVLRSLVSPLLLAALRKHYRGLERAGYLETDRTQVKDGRDGIYCELAGLFLQDQLAQLINRIVPTPVKPSYCWFFKYRPSAVLWRHTDRAQNRWNVSFAVDAHPHVDESSAWPLFMQVGDEARAVRLGAGDAVLYSGTETPHWRDPLPAGQTASMCLLHYVDEHFTGTLG